MELLERAGALATLAAAQEAAARGEGRVVFVSGEPGIGKTALVTRFRSGLDAGTRVLLGTCDDLAIPRPLGPFRDLAGRVSPALAEALAGGGTVHDVQTLLVAELRLPPRPTVLVLEDVHWADDATLDTVTVLGRRIAALPAVLVLTFRSGEAPPGHRLRATLGVIRADDVAMVELAPLSEQAVAVLAGERAAAVYAASAGNPFYVGELVAAQPSDELPQSVATAVLGRASRLDDDARDLVQLVAMVPSRARTSLLDVVMPGWPAAAEEPERRQLLEVDDASVRFRHELARHAIRASVPIAARRRLHARILAALLAACADPAEIVHHAEAAGARDVVAEFALVAARRAAALDSNREALSHYRRAADFLAGLPPAEQAAVLEELAGAAYVAARLDEAFAAMDRAIASHGALRDAAAVGRCTRALSRYFWYAGDGVMARSKAAEAIAILEPLGESAELGGAYSALSQLAMLAEEGDEAIRWGEQALAVADALGDEHTRAHAHVNVASARLQHGDVPPSSLIEVHALADAAGDRDEAARALVNLAYTLMSRAQPAPARVHARAALAYVEQHELHTFTPYIRTMLAWLDLRAGAWQEAERATRDELARAASLAVPQLLARTVLAELAVRRGDADAEARLAELAPVAERTGEPQRIVPLLELAAEHALLVGAPPPVDRFADVVQGLHRGSRPAAWRAVRAAAWASVVGLDVRLDAFLAPPYAALLRRDWRAAADAFGAVGWDYDRALFLSLLDDETALGEALATARRLGAEPLARRVSLRLRALGLRVPQGPRGASRAHPVGLTARQAEVLALLVEGRTNGEIAERLVVSPRTAEHHVAAVLAKLDAPTRRDAARRATELGLLEQV